MGKDCLEVDWMLLPCFLDSLLVEGLNLLVAESLLLEPSLDHIESFLAIRQVGPPGLDDHLALLALHVGKLFLDAGCLVSLEDPERDNLLHLDRSLQRAATHDFVDSVVDLLNSSRHCLVLSRVSRQQLLCLGLIGHPDRLCRISPLGAWVASQVEQRGLRRHLWVLKT